MKLLARYSEGLRLAAAHGPRSGVVFEYACRNRPQGNGVLGRWVDRSFLRSRAWTGARQRVASTKETVAEILVARRAAGLGTMILDVACGSARYLRELARTHAADDLAIVCHDRDAREVMLGRQLAAAEGLRQFTFSVGDATDDSSYLTSREPDIVLAIGVVPTLPPDEAVRTVMRLSFSHLSPGGCFICTTLAQSHARFGYWDADAYGARPAVSAPELIAAWLRASGFVRIDQRFSQPHGFALIGWKPAAS